MSRRTTSPRHTAKAVQVKHRCADCANITEVWEPHRLLSVEGKPTLGTCPHWKESRCVLLSMKSFCPHFVQRVADCP